MRATLHDELMREAGFETDYYLELERRRERRRRRLRRDILLALSAVAYVGALAGFGAWIVGITGTGAHFPRALLAAAALAGTLGATAAWLAGRMTRDEEVDERRRRSLWSRILVPPGVRPLVDWFRKRVERRREVEA